MGGVQKGLNLDDVIYGQSHIAFSFLLFQLVAAAAQIARINCSVKVDKFIHGLTDLSQTQTKAKDH